ncbi:hypothetical protein SAMN05421693_10110 [Ectothiorhodospira magna]|uniref:Uncharacterized protein n=2 Tax=Ectothiorhodospira magna TaxID=867345 RepID=A0A1H8YY61_9GAMM|nr:hypothetical protein SAMN05421693_10110 [Ectothiorhodospira magna]
MGWLNLDAWSEMYVGLHWMVTHELPERHYETAPRHGPLSKLVLLGSHHLIEVMLFKCIRRILDNSAGAHPDLDHRYDRVQFLDAFSKWPERLVGSPFDDESEPFKSVLTLSRRRNATIHKESALTTLDMARAALYTAVYASEAIERHLLGSKNFKYERVLKKYPLPSGQWFSEVKLIDAKRGI